VLAETPATANSPHDTLVAERDEYRDTFLRIKADFDNYKKRVAKDQAATVERAAGRLVTDLLPVLDACEAALAHGAADVEPIYKSLLDVLEKGGLTRMSPEGQAFDPNLHEAVMHEPGDDDSPGTVVVGNLRTGYLWNGRVVRPAMVKVKG
jgi:molecular chaperone GrpE